MTRILVIDDEALVCRLAQEVGEGLGFEVLTTTSLRTGLALAKDGVDIILLDVILPDGNGLEKVKEFRSMPLNPEILMITGHGDDDIVERALHHGVGEFLSKPLTVPKLRKAITQLAAYREQQKETDNLQSYKRPGILGSSPQLLGVLQAMAEAAQSNVNVLFWGETGVGKELFARALHENSPVAGQPFITVDCASMPSTLVESHLFGHAKGAFTGADKSRKGLVAEAHRGTLLLDEVGELPMAVQGSFLRVLETRRYRPVGEVHEEESQFRLVSATNRELDKLVAQGDFRADLLFRLRGLSIRIPSLRERVDDIPELARHAVERFCMQHAIPNKGITEGCMDVLLNYSWPGNVRELFHCMARACVASVGQDSIFAGHLPTDLRVSVTRQRVSSGYGKPETERMQADAGFLTQSALAKGTSTQSNLEFVQSEPLPTLRVWKGMAENRYILRLMDICHGDVPKAAAMAGVSRGYLYELLKKCGYQS